MRKIFLVAVAVLMTTALGAQNAEKLLNNITKAEAAAADEKKSQKVATWIKLGDTYYKAYQEIRGKVQEGWSVNDVMFTADKAPVSEKQVSINGIPYYVQSFDFYDLYYNEAGIVAAVVVTKSLDGRDLLVQATNAYIKAAELDVKKSKYDNLKEKLISLRDALVNEGMYNYTVNDIEKAAINFENSLPCSENPVVNAVDTMIVYYTGITYNMLGNLPKAKQYFTKCMEMGYLEGGDVPAALADIAKKEGDVDAAKAYLNEAFQKFPSSQAVLVNLINLYIETNDDPEKILALIRAAQVNEPNNASLVYAEGNVYKNLGQNEKAIEYYQKSYDMDNNYVYGVYAVGNTYFDMAIAYQTEMDALDFNDVKGYEAIKAKFDESLKNSIVPFETAFNSPAATEDVKLAVAQALKQVYFRYREEDPSYAEKYQKFNDYLKAAGIE